jgi:hypothetical protein
MLKGLFIKFVPEYLLWAYRRSDFYHNKLVKQWESPENSHLIKEKSIIEFQIFFNSDIFIETGTSHGEMVYKLYNYFKNLITIELEMNLFRSAKRRLRSYSKIEFLHGDSGKILPEIICKITSPCIFWLDAHYSGGYTAIGEKDTHIEEELNAILSQQLNHIILIDDASYFGNPEYPDYPELKKIKNIVTSKKPDYNFEVCEDVIRAYKNN